MYNYSMNGFKYIIFPEHTYIVPVEDGFGNTQNVEILGQDVLKEISKWYLQTNNDVVSYSHEQNAKTKSQQGCGCNCQKG
jgi:hypothetical protein